MFSYFYVHEQNQISNSILASNVGFLLNCGYFSYFQLMNQFKLICGTSNYLNCISNSECEILKDLNISRIIESPSIYGLNPYSLIDRTILPQSDWLNGILSSMKSKIESGRSVIILMQSIDEINSFKDFIQQKNIPVTILTLTEESKNKDSIIRRAKNPKTLTLCTKIFFNESIAHKFSHYDTQEKGGIYIISTYLPESSIEECKISSKSLRRDMNGSYIQLLNANILFNSITGFSNEKLRKEVTTISQIEWLNNLRDTMYNHKITSLIEKEKINSSMNLVSIEYIKSLLNFDETQQNFDKLKSQLNLFNS